MMELRCRRAVRLLRLLGTVIDTMIPSAVKKRIGIAYAVRAKLWLS